MKMANKFVQSLLGVAAASAFACGTGGSDSGDNEGTSLEDLVGQRCSLIYNCNCVEENPEVLDNAQQCREQALDGLEPDKQAAEAAGLEFDEACAEREAEFWSSVGCGWPEDEDYFSINCVIDCPLWYGDVGPGEECLQIANRATNCAQGLECVGGFCQDSCNTWRLAEGAKCYDAANPPTGTCVTGTFCDVGDTDRCQPTPTAGEPCPKGVCDGELWCNQYAEPEAICQTLGAVGTQCDSDQGCQTGYCIGGRCAPLPEAGESCNGECAGDLFCDGVCTVPQSEGQSCGSLPCAADLVCENGVCTQGYPWVCYPSF